MVKLAGGILKFRLADLGDDGIDKNKQLFDFLMREHDGIIHIVVGNLAGACLNHDDFLFGSGDREFKRADLALLIIRIENGLAVHKTDERTADRSVPRDIRNRQRDGSADHRRNFRRTVGVDGHDRQRQRDIVAQILREERTNRTVDDTACQNSLFRRLAFTAEESARYFAYGIHFFIIIDGEGKEIDTVARLRGSGSARENDGFPITDHTGAVGESCDLAGFHLERPAGVFKLEYFVILEHFLSPFCYSIYFQAKNIRDCLALKYDAELPNHI